MKKYIYFFTFVLSSWALSAGAQIAQPNSGTNSSSAAGFTDFKTAVGTITGYINLLIPLIIGLAVFLFIFGLLKYVTAGADESKIKEARNFIIFGIIGIAVMVSVWGLVTIVVNTFFPDTGLFIPQIKS